VAEPTPSFFARLILAWVAYFRTLFDPQFAAGVVRLRAGALPPPADREPAPVAPSAASPTRTTTALEDAKPDSALQLLAILQREGRLLDFLEENVTGFSDAEIGAAARVVHDGCKKALDEHFSIAPVRSDDEGSRITLPAGFDASEVKLIGNVVGSPPFTGTLQHRGWRAVSVKLPQLAKGHHVEVLAPAEVEL
jgi:hypothetical protein